MQSRLRKALKILNIDPKKESVRIVLMPFLRIFEEEEEVVLGAPEKERVYEFYPLMTILFILSCSSTSEKARAIFRLYDQNYDGLLTKEELRQCLSILFTYVRKYSELFSELDPDARISYHYSIDKRVHIIRKVI